VYDYSNKSTTPPNYSYSYSYGFNGYQAGRATGVVQTYMSKTDPTAANVGSPASFQLHSSVYTISLRLDKGLDGNSTPKAIAEGYSLVGGYSSKYDYGPYSYNYSYPGYTYNGYNYPGYTYNETYEYHYNYTYGYSRVWNYDSQNSTSTYNNYRYIYRYNET